MIRISTAAAIVFMCGISGLRAQEEAPIQAGQPAPGFYLKMLDGSDFFSRDYFGEPRAVPKARKERHHVVLSFFATWCSPCRKEVPELERLMIRFPEIRFFLIDVGEKEDKVSAHLQSTPITIPILLDQYGRIAKKYGVMDGNTDMAVLPTLVIVDKNGVIRFFKKGYSDGDETRIESEIEKLH